MNFTQHAQLLNRLALALAEYDSANLYHDAAPLIARARQAAEEIERREVPSDEELLSAMPQDFRDDLAAVSRMASDACSCKSVHVGPGIFRIGLNTGALAFARAVLARFGGGEGE